MKRRLTLFLLVVVGTTLALLVGEWIVRRKGVAPDMAFLDRAMVQLTDNKVLAYEMRPPLGPGGEPIRFEDKPGGLNTWGFRDVEHRADKTPETTRILVLGDSIAYGLRVATFAETFPARLEQNLRAAGVAAEVINFGVCGYDTGQALELLKTRGLALQPDVVILAYCLNDHVGISDELVYPLLQRARGDAALGKPWFGRLFAHSALYRLLRYRIVPDVMRTRSVDDLLKDYNRADAVPGGLAELRQLREEHQFEALVVVFPLLETLADNAHADGHATMHRLCEQNGLPVLDLLPTFQACAGGDLERIAADLFHPTAVGHQCAAAAISQQLLASGVVRPQ